MVGRSGARITCVCGVRKSSSFPPSCLHAHEIYLQRYEDSLYAPDRLSRIARRAHAQAESHWRHLADLTIVIGVF